MEYEIDFRYIKDCSHKSLFCTLTGLEPEEVDHVVKRVMKGRDFINGFRSLGFNTNPRFCKFDPETKYPCILRCQGDLKGTWYAFIYYKGIIWDPYHNDFYNLDDVKDMRYFRRKYYFTNFRIRITSMLQVWI